MPVDGGQISPVISIVDGGGGGSSSGGSSNSNCFTFSYSGSWGTYSQQPSGTGAQDKPAYTQFKAADSMTVTIKNIYGTDLVIDKIYVYVGDTLVRTINCFETGGPAASSYGITIKADETLTIPLHEDSGNLYARGNWLGTYYGRTQIESVSPYTTTGSGSRAVKVYFSASAYGTYNLPPVTFKPLVVDSALALTTTSVTKKFYKNATFSSSGLKAICKYYYDSTFGSNIVAKSFDCASSCSITGYDMEDPGKQTVTVKYGTPQATYEIEVVGVKSVSENSANNYKYLVDDRPDAPTSVKITYTDDTSRTVTGSNSTLAFSWESGDFDDVGERDFTYSIYDSNTKETITVETTKNVYDVSAIEITTAPTKTSYQTNENFDASGMAVTATYGEAGTAAVAVSSCTITTPDMSVVTASSDVTVAYRSKSDTTPIRIDGITNVRLYVPDEIKKVLKGTSTYSLTGLQVFYTCSDQEETELQLSSSKVSIDTSDINLSKNGEYTVSVSVTHQGNTITETYTVTVYSLESLTLTDYKAEFIKTGDTNPTFGTGSLAVTGVFSDGTSRALSSSEYEVTAPDNMDVGTHTVTVSATIGTAVSETYEIEVIDDYPVEIVEVDTSLWVDTFVDTDVFSKANIVVYATMYSGILKKQVDFYTSLDGQVFGTDITDATETFSIFVETNDPENPLEVEYNSALILNSKTLTAKYDKLNSISVSAGASTGLLRWTRAGEEFTDWINDNNHITVTASFEYGGNKTLNRGDYDIGVYDDGEKVKSLGDAWTKDDMGDNTVTVSYKGKTATYSVRISVLNGISVTSSRNPNLFVRYDDLDLTQISIKRFYTHDGENDEAGWMNLSDFTNVVITGGTKMTPDNNDGKTHDITFSYTEAGVTKTNTLTVTVKRLSSVTLDVAKISVNYGEQLSLVGHTVGVLFNTDDESHSYTINSGNKITIDSVEYTLALSLDSLIIKNKVENVTVGMTYGQETVYATFTVHCIYLDHISIDVSYYSNQTLYAGDAIDYEHIVVKKHIYTTDGDTDISGSPETLNSDDVRWNISDGYLLVAGTNSIEVDFSTGTGNTYQAKSVSATLTALQITLTSISTDVTGMTKALSSYVHGQNLNLTGLVVNAVFNRTESNHQISLTDPSLKFYLSNVLLDRLNPMLTTDDNNKVLKVGFTYDGVTKEAYVGTDGVITVVPKAVSSIRIKTAATKTNFVIGDNFNTDGMVVEVTYNDGYQEDITSGFTTDFDTYRTTAFAAGQLGSSQTVTVTYENKTATYSINVTNPVLTSLRLDTSLLTLSVANGAGFSLSGIVVTGVYDNGYEEDLTSIYTSDMNSVLSISNSVVTASAGEKTITITVVDPYDDSLNDPNTVTTSLNVTVTPNQQLQQIYLEYVDENGNEDIEGEYARSYMLGDAFDAHGIVIMARFKDNSTVRANGWTSTPKVGSIFRSGGLFDIEISYAVAGEVKQTKYQVRVQFPYESNLTDTKTYKVAFNVASVTHEEATIEFSEDTQLPLFASVTKDETPGSATLGKNIYTGGNANRDCVGYVILGKTSDVDGSVIENGKVVLFDDPVNPIDGQGNIIVKFPHYVEGYADKINRCHFGVIYNNRLFVSGNTEYPNMDWHSSEVNSSQVEHYDQEETKDLTYFSDLDYCKYGSENAAVKGYDIYRDGTLLVFKTKAQHEATIYTRTTKLVNASSYDGNVVDEGQLAEEAYPCFEVNPNGGVGALSPYSIINFVGETLVLTRDGLKAITSKEVTYNNAKYSYDVSSHINNKLLKNNELESALISQYKEKLLLKTNEGLYVGEYKIRDANSEYEWYLCDNINAYYFFEIDDQLYFSDEDGNINRFVDDGSINVKDKPRTYVGLAGTTLSIDSNNDVIIISKTYADKVQDGKEFHLLSKISNITGDITEESQVYANLGTFINYHVRNNALREGVASFDQTAYEGLIDPENNCIILRPYTSGGDIDYTRMSNTKLFFYDERKVYVDNLSGSIYELNIDIPYRLKRIDSTTPFDYRYQLLDQDGLVVDLTGLDSFRMSFRVNELELAYISNVQPYGSDGGKQFRVSVPLKEDSEGTINVPLDLIYYNGRSGTYQGVITDRQKVIQYYVGKPLNLGHDLYQKTIFMWSIINDTQIPSAMSVGYIASRKYTDFKVAVKEIAGARQLAFSEDFNFEKIHFTSDSLPHIYTRSKTLPRVGFIRFMFFNDEGTRMVLSKLDIIYAYSLLTKGVK